MATKGNGNAPARKTAAASKKVIAKKAVVKKAVVKKAAAKNPSTKTPAKKALRIKDGPGKEGSPPVPLAYLIGRLEIKDGVVGLIFKGEFVSFELQVGRPVCMLISKNPEPSDAARSSALREAIASIGAGFDGEPPDEICCGF